MVLLPFLLAIANPATEEVLPALEAFDALCGASETISDVSSAAEGLGWVAFEPHDGTEHARLASELTRMPSSRFGYEFLKFREVDSNWAVFALNVKAPNGESSLECKLIDEKADAPTDDQYLIWTGRQPTDRRQNGETEVLVWAPSHLPAPRFVAAYFVPLDSNPRFPGKGLIISSVRYYDSQVKDDE